MRNFLIVGILTILSANSAFSLSECDSNLVRRWSDVKYSPSGTSAPRIAVISGTDRSGSTTLKVSTIVANALEDLGGDVEIIDLNRLPKNTFNGSYGNPVKGFAKFQAAISEADAVVILTPEYNGSMPGSLKYFLDLVKGDSFKDKPASVIGLAAGFQGGTAAADDLRSVLQHMQANVMGLSSTLPKIGELLNADGTAFASTPAGSSSWGRLLGQLSKFKGFIDALRTPVAGEASTASPSVTSLLRKVAGSETLQTVQYDSGLQVSGNLSKVLTSSRQSDYLQFTGPTQLSVAGKELESQGTKVHSSGFGSPVGNLKDISPDLSSMTDSELSQNGINVGSESLLHYESGVSVSGKVISFTRNTAGKLVLISFENCTVLRNGETLFQPSWGTYDMAVGSSVEKVFAGAADPISYIKSTASP